MIYIITGQPGHGKTAYMVKWAYDLLKNGERIFFNIKLHPENMFKKIIVGEGFVWEKADRENPAKQILYWQNFSDWQYFENGTAFIDEGIRYFNARKWESMPELMQQRFTEHRKDKVNLIFNVQDFTFIEKTIRVLGHRYINAKLTTGSPELKKSLVPRIATMCTMTLKELNRCESMNIDPYELSDEELEKMNLHPSFEKFWIKSKYFSWYNTSEKVAEPRPEPLIHHERTCPDCGKVAVSHG